MRLSTLIYSAAVLVSEVAAHGYVPWLRINGKMVQGWDVTKGELFLPNNHAYSEMLIVEDPYTNPQVNHQSYL